MEHISLQISIKPYKLVLATLVMCAACSTTNGEGTSQSSKSGNQPPQNYSPEEALEPTSWGEDVARFRSHLIDLMKKGYSSVADCEEKNVNSDSVASECYLDGTSSPSGLDLQNAPLFYSSKELENVGIPSEVLSELCETSEGYLGMNLDGFQFYESNLNKAGAPSDCPPAFRNASFRDVTLDGTYLPGAEFVDVEFKSPLIFDNANLRGAVFDAESNLEESSFKEAILEEASLRGTFISGATFEGANLQNSVFVEAAVQPIFDRERKLTYPNRGAIFKNANLNGANFSNSYLSVFEIKGKQVPVIPTDFTNAEAEKSEFIAADCDQCIFNGSNLSDSKINRSDFSAASFDGANMSNVSARKTLFFHASFVDANMTEIDLQSAMLSSADMSNARYDGATFNGAVYNDETKFPIARWRFGPQRNHQMKYVVPYR